MAEQQNSFHLLKKKLTTAPALNYSDFQRKFLVIIDLITQLRQCFHKVGQDRPIAYAKFYARWNKIITQRKKSC